MWPELNRARFIDVRCRNVLLVRDIKTCLGFFNERFENRHQNLRIFSEIPAKLQYCHGNETLTREWCKNRFKDDFQSVLRSLRTLIFINIINGTLDGMRIDVIR